MRDFTADSLEKISRLKIASFLLFWFGIIAESLVLIRTIFEYYKMGTILNNEAQTYATEGLLWLSALSFSGYVLIHIPHIVSGYWLSKGRIGGIIFGVAISLYEIIPYLLPNTMPDLFTPFAMAIRILFAFVIYLLISGRRELSHLQSEKWRPWMNPISTKPKEF